MYAQTARTPTVRRYEHPTPLTIMNMFKLVHFQNRKCDFIKYLKLGDSAGRTGSSFMHKEDHEGAMSLMVY